MRKQPRFYGLDLRPAFKQNVTTMTLSPKSKQALSGLAVAMVTGAAVALEQALANPPFTLQKLGLAALTGAIGGLLHTIPAWGTEQAVATKLIDREPK